MKKILVNIIFSGLIVLFAGSTWAHAHSAEVADAMKGPHGGQLVAAGHYHFELLAKDGELRLYVTDHNNHEILARGGSGKANILDKDGNRVASVKLVPVFANFMKGTGDFKITPETTISVFAVVENTQTNAARFSSLVGEGSSNTKTEGDVEEDTSEEQEEDISEEQEEDTSEEQEEDDDSEEDN